MRRGALITAMVVVAVLGTATTRVGASSGVWTAAEQQVVYEVNRARHDPAGYLAALGLDGAGLLPRPPLAVNPMLASAAGFRAVDLAATDGAFGHLSSDGRTPNEVVEDFGYLLPWWWPDAGNNVETFFGGPEARLLITALGSGPHRSHLLGQGGYADHREMGVGSSSDGFWWALQSAQREGFSSFLTGVAFDDCDDDGRMDPGEGLEGVTVTIDGSASVVTGPGGGWALPVRNGEHTVSASGPGFAGTASARVSVIGYNVGVEFVSGRPDPLVFEYDLCLGREPTIIGTGGDDVITGTPGADVIHGLGGNDAIYGLGGNDLICGGGGRDRLFGAAGSDRLLGQRGDDRLRGGIGEDLGRGGGGSGDVCTAVEAAFGCEK